MIPLDPRSLCQIEIAASDLQRSLQFYAQVFGWLASPADLHELVVLDVPAECGFGISLVPANNAGEAKARGGVVLYFAVEQADLLVQRAEAAGGRKRFGPKTLPGYGVIFQIEDPDGVVWGVFQRVQTP